MSINSTGMGCLFVVVVFKFLLLFWGFCFFYWEGGGVVDDTYSNLGFYVRVFKSNILHTESN